MPRFVTPVQNRSRKVLHRILDVAAVSFSRSGYHGASVRDICARARVTTGAFYARFAAKDDLMLALLDSLAPEFEAIVDATVAARHEQGVDAAVRVLLGRTIDVYRRRGGLLRAISARAREAPALAATMRRLNRGLMQRLTQLSAADAGPRERAALELALFCVLVSIKEIFLDRQLVDEPLLFDDAALVAELSQLFSSYVASREAPVEHA